MPQQGTKLVKVEGRTIRVPMDATPDEIDAIANPPAVTPRPEAGQPGAMQRQPGGPIFTPKDIMRGAVDKALQSRDYETIRRIKEGEFAQDFPKSSGVDPRAYQQESWRYASPGFNPRIVAKMAIGAGLGTIGGAYAGGKAGEYLGGPAGGTTGKVLGGALGGLYGGYKGGSEQPLLSGNLGKLFSLSRWGSAIKALTEGEPNAVAGTAREMAGGTAATAMPGAAAETGAGTTGAQAGPSAGPKSASELSSVVQRTRAGIAPGTAASPIVTPQQASQESQQFAQNQAQARAQGMANAARNPEAPGSATAIPARFSSPEYTPRPSTPTVASTTQPGFSGLTPSPTPQPPGEQGGGTIDLSPTGILAMLRKRLGQARQQP